ncbi:glutamine amidotransferase [Novosphingobium album (ex Liu et al. 2023)]|uniref:Glutamine amidotransferase n=1 Tax=Novosphingobium album (ex Liu et al. 2023) TaxID=3031130 RepID=A0ABT5WXT6_9SPHN|nr:glutamine amidotransferase [Novosphingobium album (ex Liu et al. 2023)]MDE8654712.1 glutamine amidotransferase [Novosphingobium album (ex Liu et al. 2023)]
MTGTVRAIRHVDFETLGTFEPAIAEAGYCIEYVDVAAGGLARLDPLESDLLVVLGGPIGVYETDAYPFLNTECNMVKARLDAGLPVLGICLGAQIIAAALGAKVAATGVKEIGFAPVALTDAGTKGPLHHLADMPVLHWHGDAFDLPDGAELLATTPVANQAFAIGPHVLALQFHLEADTTHDLEAWLIGHAAELAGAGIERFAGHSVNIGYATSLRRAMGSLRGRNSTGESRFARWANFPVSTQNILR